MSEAIIITAKLADTRATVRNHLRERYASRMREFGDIVTRVSLKTGDSILSTGTTIASHCDESGDAYNAMLVLAATVELLDPTPAEALAVFA